MCFPLKKCNICRPRKAVQFACATFCLSVAKNFHVFWTRGYEEFQEGQEMRSSNCGKPSRQFESYVRPWIAFALVSVLPFVAILAFNVGIVHTLIKTRRPIESIPSLENSKRSATDKQFSQTTIMCLSASFLFLFTITPSIVLLIGKPYWTKPDYDYKYNKEYEAAKAISNVMVYLNHSLTFLLYCMTGRRFRVELVHLFLKRTEDSRSLYQTQYTTHLGQHSNPGTPHVTRSTSFASVYQVNVVVDNMKRPSRTSNTLLPSSLLLNPKTYESKYVNGGSNSKSPV